MYFFKFKNRHFVSFLIQNHAVSKKTRDAKFVVFNELKEPKRVILNAKLSSKSVTL